MACSILYIKVWLDFRICTYLCNSLCIPNIPHQFSAILRHSPPSLSNTLLLYPSMSCVPPTFVPIHRNHPSGPGPHTKLQQLVKWPIRMLMPLSPVAQAGPQPSSFPSSALPTSPTPPQRAPATMTPSHSHVRKSELFRPLSSPNFSPPIKWLQILDCCPKTCTSALANPLMSSRAHIYIPRRIPRPPLCIHNPHHFSSERSAPIEASG